MKIIRVSKDGLSEFYTLSDAINAAGVNTKILVSAGIYNEQVIIDKDIEIIADDEAEKVIIENTSAPSVLMQAENAKLKGFTIQTYLGQTKNAKLNVFTHQGTEYRDILPIEEHCCIKILQGHLALEDCQISSELRWCLWVDKNANPHVKRCDIQGGIMFCDYSLGRIEDSHIWGPESGICFADGADPIIKNCRIHDGAHGITASERSKGLVEDCEIYNVTYGITCFRSSTVLRRCKVHDCKYGIFPDKTNIVEDCDVFRIQKVSPGHICPKDSQARRTIETSRTLIY